MNDIDLEAFRKAGRLGYPSTEGDPPIVRVILHGNDRWYITSYDPEDDAWIGRYQSGNLLTDWGVVPVEHMKEEWELQIKRFPRAIPFSEAYEMFNPKPRRERKRWKN